MPKHLGEYLDARQSWVALTLLACDGGGCTVEKVDEHGYGLPDQTMTTPPKPHCDRSATSARCSPRTRSPACSPLPTS